MASLVSQINPFLPQGGFCPCFNHSNRVQTKTPPPRQPPSKPDTARPCWTVELSFQGNTTVSVPRSAHSALPGSDWSFRIKGDPLTLCEERKQSEEIILFGRRAGASVFNCDAPSPPNGQGCYSISIPMHKPRPEPLTLFMIQSASSMALLIICWILSGLSSSE